MYITYTDPSCYKQKRKVGVRALASIRERKTVTGRETEGELYTDRQTDT